MMDLETFFEEKEINFTSWELTHNDMTYHIDSDCIIEAILSTQGRERELISNTLLLLEIKNQPIENYLKHLAEALIKNNF